MQGSTRMDAGQYLEDVLAVYSNTFDIVRPFVFHGMEFPAFGEFHQKDEKYVLKKDVTLWSAHSNEYVLFSRCERLTEEFFIQCCRMLEDQMEPELVRKKARYPEENHMFSYLTLVFVSDRTPEPEVLRRIKNYHYHRNYLFTFRGRCEAHVVLVDLEKREATTNRASRGMRKFYLGLLKKEEAAV